MVAVNVDNTDNYSGRLSKMMWNMAYDAQNSKLNLMYSASEIDIDATALSDLYVSCWKK